MYGNVLMLLKPRAPTLINTNYDPNYLGKQIMIYDHN